MSACKLHSTEEAVSSTFAGVRGRVDAAAHNARRWLADRPGSVGDWASRVRVVALSLEGWNGRARRLESAQFAARTFIL